MIGGSYTLGLWPTSLPAPPEVDVSRLDPAIADRINETRAQVLENRDSASAWGKLGMVYWVHNISREALICLERAEQLDPVDPRWPYLVGTITYTTDQSRAINAYERAAHLAGTRYLTVQMRLAEVYFDQGRFPEAIVLLDAAIKNKPDDPRALRLRGQIAMAEGNAEQARELLERSVRIDPNNPATYMVLAQAHQRLGRSDDAARMRDMGTRMPPAAPDPDMILDEAYALRTGVDAWIGIARNLMLRGQVDMGIGLFQAIVKDYPNSWQGWAGLGRAYQVTGDFQRSEDALSRALQLEPGEVDVNVAQSYTLLQLGRVAEAEQCARKAQAAKPDDPDVNAVLGMVLSARGDHQGAADALKRSIEVKPHQAEAQRALAASYAALGLFREALLAARESERLDPGNLQVEKLIQSVEHRLVSSGNSSATSPVNP